MHWFMTTCELRVLADLRRWDLTLLKVSGLVWSVETRTPREGTGAIDAISRAPLVLNRTMIDDIFIYDFLI